MRRLALLGAAVCALTWLTPTPAVGGWLWDLGNALGFVGLAAMLALNFESGHGRAHRALAWFAVAAVIVHGAWLLVLDETVVEYLKVTMPGYMAAGLLAFAVLFLVVLVSARARHPAPGRQGFRGPHWTLSVMAVAGAGYHVAGSAFYLHDRLQLVLFAGLLAGCVAWPRLRWPSRVNWRLDGDGEYRQALLRQVIALLVLAGAVLVLPRNL